MPMESFEKSRLKEPDRFCKALPVAVLAQQFGGLVGFSGKKALPHPSRPGLGPSAFTIDRTPAALRSRLRFSREQQTRKGEEKTRRAAI